MDFFKVKLTEVKESFFGKEEEPDVKGRLQKIEEDMMKQDD